MKHFIVTTGEYSDYRIQGVFSSKDNATTYIATMNREKTAGGDIEEYEVDAPLSEEWKPIYFCHLDLDGKLVEMRTEKDQLVSPHWTEITPPSQHTYGFFCRSSVSSEHALKLSAETRQAWLREVPHAKFWWNARKDQNDPIKIQKFWYAEPLVDIPNLEQYPYVTQYAPGTAPYCATASLVSADDAVRQLEEVLKDPMRYLAKAEKRMAQQQIETDAEALRRALQEI